MVWLLRLVLTTWDRCLCGLTAVCGCDLCICRVVWVSCYCVRCCGWVLLLVACCFGLLIRMLVVAYWFWVFVVFVDLWVCTCCWL